MHLQGCAIINKLQRIFQFIHLKWIYNFINLTKKKRRREVCLWMKLDVIETLVIEKLLNRLRTLFNISFRSCNEGWLSRFHCRCYHAHNSNLVRQKLIYYIFKFTRRAAVKIKKKVSSVKAERKIYFTTKKNCLIQASLDDFWKQRRRQRCFVIFFYLFQSTHKRGFKRESDVAFNPINCGIRDDKLPQSMQSSNK